MVVVMTSVHVKPDSIPKIQDVFQRTNPDLVAGQGDWLEAKFTANFDQNLVTVLAFWKDQESYRTFSSSEPFKKVMSQFRPYFEEAPEVTVNEVLFEM